MFTKVLRSFGMRGRVLTLDAPISGDVIPLSEVNDQTFATGLLGQGVAIRPTGTRVIAPADAKVEAIFPTGHAVALNTVDGLDVLIHVGLDTVQLEGKHFTVMFNFVMYPMLSIRSWQDLSPPWKKKTVK